MAKLLIMIDRRFTSSETDKLSSNLGKYHIFFIQLGIGFSLCLILGGLISSK